jgi:hypothetical protein
VFFGLGLRREEEVKAENTYCVRVEGLKERVIRLKEEREE